MDEHTRLAAELRQLLEDAAGRPLPLDQPQTRAQSLWRLGLTSHGYLTMLSAIEDRYGISWSLDEPAEAFSSFDSLVEHLLQKTAAAQQEPA